jgi:TonB-dependent receptor
MTEINIGKRIMLLPGVRYEYTENDYSSIFGTPSVSEEGQQIIGSLTDTTGGQTYDDLLPMVHLKYNATDWFDLRLAVTKTLSRPNYFNLVPWRRIIHFDGTIEQGNPSLKHTVAWNYDAFISFYNNLGLFTIGGFYKELENIDYLRTSRLTEGEYSGYELTEPVNDENITTVKGFEIELQTNFRYLPKPFDGIVLYANYSRIFSQTFFPLFEVGPRSTEPPYGFTIIDTVREGRMPGQADYIANLSIGYEKGGFSGRLSMIYQGPTLQTVGTRSELDGFTDDYVRWDMVFRQNITSGFSIYANLNNITNKAEKAFLGSRNFPTKQEYFGWSAEVGLRYKF